MKGLDPLHLVRVMRGEESEDSLTQEELDYMNAKARQWKKEARRRLWIGYLTPWRRGNRLQRIVDKSIVRDE